MRTQSSNVGTDYRSLFSLLLPATGLILGGCGALPDESNSSGEAVRRASEHSATQETDEVSGPMFDSIGRRLGPITSRIVTANRETDQSFGLVARVEVQTNEVLEFYEPAPGVIVISAAGAPEEALGQHFEEAVSSEKIDYRLLWDAASNGGKMPDELEEAIARSDAAENPASIQSQGLAETEGGSEIQDFRPSESQEASVETTTNEGLGQVAQAIHIGSEWCNTTWETWDMASGDWDNVGYNCPSNYHEVHCWDHVTGTGSAQNPDAAVLKSSVCPYDGNVLFTLESDEYSTGSWTVSENTARASFRIQSGCGSPFDDCPWVQTTVSQASGDAYNYRFIVFEE